MDVKKEFFSDQQTFWTACPSCKVRYQYSRDIVNKALICGRCKQAFIAYDVDNQRMPSEANNELLFSRTKECPGTSSRMRLQRTLENSDSKTKGKGHPNVRKEDRNETKAKEHKESKKEVSAENDNSKGPEDANELESNHGFETGPADPDIIVVRGAGTIKIPNPDFFNFDKDREEKCFEVGHIWAVFDDTADCMPRFYALIRNVSSTAGFKVRVTWLEPCPEDADEIAWENAELPIACGKFKNGKTENQEDICTFSHRVDMKKNTIRCSWVYPQKGETWALFKNWDIRKWSSDPDNHRNYEYDFVEVLSDYTKESGINVAYLVKIEGFVGLFKPTRNNGKQVSCQIPPNECFRFSHRVPSYKTTGREREDVPEGYFELDPFSLPRNMLESSSNVSVRVDVESSADGLEMDGVKSCNASTLGRKSGLTCQADHVKVMGSSSGVNVKSHTTVDKIPSSASHQDPCEIQEPEFHNFNDDKSPEKFKPGQIWALNCELDRFPRYYALIERVQLSPNFKLFIKWLEACAPPKGVIQWVDKKVPICCGTFTSGGNAEFADTSSFSHLSTGVSAKNENKYEIYPRKGEVWALYRNFNRAWTCSDLQKCEYDMVEVLEVYDAHWVLVLALRPAGFGSVFEAEIKSGHELIIGIPWVELLRFSHQVPAFQLTESRHRSLKGCWVIDPKSMS